jgi:hypothetical protein
MLLLLDIFIIQYTHIYKRILVDEYGNQSMWFDYHQIWLQTNQSNHSNLIDYNYNKLLKSNPLIYGEYIL